jgi:hypothetical protein
VRRRSGGVEGDLIRQEPIIPVVHGDMTHAHTLREAGIDRAVVVMLLAGDDTLNLEAALLARELNPHVHVVLRMSSKRVLQRLDNLLRRGVIRNFQLIDSVSGAAPRCVELCRVAVRGRREGGVRRRWAWIRPVKRDTSSSAGSGGSVSALCGCSRGTCQSSSWTAPSIATTRMSRSWCPSRSCRSCAGT